MPTVAVDNGIALFYGLGQRSGAYRVVALAWMNHMSAATDADGAAVHHLKVIAKDLFL